MRASAGPCKRVCVRPGSQSVKLPLGAWVTCTRLLQEDAVRPVMLNLLQQTEVTTTSPVNLASFMSRARPALEWLFRNLNLGCAPGSAFGAAAMQAPVATPAMIWQLEDALRQALGDDRVWCDGLTQGTVACCRFIQHSMLFLCARGKQDKQRHGFLWSVPRFAATNGCDLGKAFCHTLCEHKRHRGPDYWLRSRRRA